MAIGKHDDPLAVGVPYFHIKTAGQVTNSNARHPNCSSRKWIAKKTVAPMGSMISISDMGLGENVGYIPNEIAI